MVSPTKDDTPAPRTAAAVQYEHGTVDALAARPQLAPAAATNVSPGRVAFASATAAAPAANDANAAASSDAGLLTTGNEDNNNQLPVPALPPVALPAATDDVASVRTATSGMTVGTVDKDKRTSTAAKTSARMKKKTSPKTSTSSKPKKLSVKVKCRTKTTRKKLARKIDPDDPAFEIIQQFQRDDRNFTGRAVGKVGKNWRIKFDDFPHDHEGIVLARNDFDVLAEDEDAPEYDRKTAEEERIAEECAKVDAALTKQQHKQKSLDALLKLSTEDLKTVKSYEMKYGDKDTEKIVWKILQDDEAITEDAMKTDDANVKSPMKVDIEWNPDTKKVNYNKIFFDSFFPSVEGKAKVIDKFLDSKECSMYHTKENDKIKFHREGEDDPDVLVKLCITILVTAACEVEKGVDNLFKQGLSDGFKDYPNYNQYIPKNYFKCFMLAFPFLWCDEKYWYQDPRTLPWAVITPFLDKYNKTRTNLLNVIYLILDESMSAWRPKTSKTGGLPNITHEPRKPKDLGSMLRNGAECITGMFVHHDIVEDPSTQRLKKYQIDEDDETKLCTSHLPQGEPVLDHVAECLRQVEGAQVKEGGWTGGDAWFGSINSCVELKLRKGIFSTFIVKQNLAYFPMQELKAILLARYGTRPAGHWVVMKANISGVELFVMAYAWSNKGISYFVSSCGTTIRHEQNYFSKFEDEMGCVQVKELARPAIAHMLYEFAPLIDEHNKARQSSLALEESWLTKNCWFRLMTTLTGMAVVDMQRWDRHVRNNSEEASRRGLDGDFTIVKMASLIGRPLRTGEMKYRNTPQPSTRGDLDSDGRMKPITRIQGEDGSIVYRTGKEKKAIQQRCYICRRYYPRYKNTQWCCRKCKMPLCQIDRSATPGSSREMSCVEEHLSSKNHILACNEKDYQSNLPNDFLCYPVTSTGSKRAANTKDPVTPSPSKRSRRRH